MTTAPRWTRFYPRSISGKDNEGDPDPPTALRRVYKRNQRGWPRLFLSVRLDESSWRMTPIVEISCSIKPALGQWWDNAEVPVQLLNELMEMLAVVQNEADE